MGTGERAFFFSKKVLDHKANCLLPYMAQVEKKRPSVNLTVHFHEAVLKSIMSECLVKSMTDEAQT
jgi:hypothetical protein